MNGKEAKGNSRSRWRGREVVEKSTGVIIIEKSSPVAKCRRACPLSAALGKSRLADWETLTVSDRPNFTRLNLLYCTGVNGKKGLSPSDQGYVRFNTARYNSIRYNNDTIRYNTTQHNPTQSNAYCRLGSRQGPSSRRISGPRPCIHWTRFWSQCQNSCPGQQ
jgi:hypothetical protein